MIKYWSIQGADCEITIEHRPAYCDRGNYYAKVFPRDGSKLALDLDGQDCWPRYYFFLANAMPECVAWLQRRNQYTSSSVWQERSVPEQEHANPD